MNRDDLAHLLLLLNFIDKIGVIKFRMSESQSWNGQGYFWPRC